MSIDLSRSRYPPEGVPPWPKQHFSHQPAGIEWLVEYDNPAKGRHCPGVGLLADDTGAGKGKQVIDAACVLFTKRQIEKMIVVAPGAIRSVWVDKDLGELAKHLWYDLPTIVTEYHSRVTTWTWEEGKSHPQNNNDKPFDVYVSNYEFLRSEQRLAELLQIADKRTLLVLDESREMNNWNSLQTKAMRKLRKRCGRVWELNGTPIADKPFDLFAQANLMDPGILGITSMTKFKSMFAVMGGFMVDTPWGQMATQVLKYQNLDVLQARMAPYVLRRLKDDMNLPPKLPPVVATVPLTPLTWSYYRQMRDDMVVELSESSLSMTQQTMVKIMRLSQITSGFLGGVEQMEEIDDDSEWKMGDDGERLVQFSTLHKAGDKFEAPTDPNLRSFLDGLALSEGGAEGLNEQARQLVPAALAPSTLPLNIVVEVGREKLDAFLDWLDVKLAEDESLKLLVYTRFRPELLRTADELRKKYPKMDVGLIYGGNKRQERADAKKLMDPRTCPKGPATVLMTSAGTRGLTLTASHTIARLSRSESLYVWQQGDDRIHRPTQVHPCSYYDFVAVGPRGQKTVDKDILQALMAKLDVSTWTTSAWVTRLKDVAA